MISLLKKTFTRFSDDDCMSMAAGLAYYTIFAFPPLMVILITIGSWTFDRERVEETVQTHMSGVLDAEQIDAIVSQARDTGGGIVAGLISIGLLLFGATGVVAQLQIGLNRIWEVQPDPDKGGVRTFVGKRIISLAMILAVAFILLVSMVLTSLLAALGDYLQTLLRGDLWQPVFWVLNLAVNWLVFTALFASMFKILPDADIDWRDVGIGAAATALLFMIGQALLGVYMGTADVAGPYGAAGTLVLLLVWVYYSSLILLLGAEFTKVWAMTHGGRVRPSEGAVRAIHRTEIRHTDGAEVKPY